MNATFGAEINCFCADLLGNFERTKIIELVLKSEKRKKNGFSAHNVNRASFFACFFTRLSDYITLNHKSKLYLGIFSEIMLFCSLV